MWTHEKTLLKRLQNCDRSVGEAGNLDSARTQTSVTHLSQHVGNGCLNSMVFHQYLFTLLGSRGAKADCRMLMKLTPGLYLSRIVSGIFRVRVLLFLIERVTSDPKLLRKKYFSVILNFIGFEPGAGDLISMGVRRLFSVEGKLFRGVGAKAYYFPS